MWIWADDFQDSGEKCRKYHQSCILAVQTNILPKNVLEKKNSTLEDFQGKNLRYSAWKCPEELSEGTNFPKKINSNHLLTLGEKDSNFSLKVPSRAVRTAFYVSKGWILGKKTLEVYSSLIFSDTAQNFLVFMRRVFCRTIIYAFYSPKGSFWEKLLFEICASHLRISSDSRCGFIAQNFSLELSNLNSKCPDHSFSEKTCWNNYQFLYFFTVSSNFSDFWQEKMTGLPKVPSTVSEIFKRD